MTTEKIVKLLNEIHQLDPNFLATLVNDRLVINNKLAKSNKVITYKHTNGVFYAGIMGVLNAAVDDPEHVIVYRWLNEHDPKLIRFEVEKRADVVNGVVPIQENSDG